MLACRADRIAARSRGLAAGSGRPWRAAVVNSRISLVKILPRFLSCAPFRYMMFLNCEWPDIVAHPGSSFRVRSAGSYPAMAVSNPIGGNPPTGARPNKPIWQDCGDSGANWTRVSVSNPRHVRRQASAEPHRLDMARQTRRIVDHDKSAAQRPLALRRLCFLARHLGDEAADRGGLLHADHRIVVAAHARIAHIGGASDEDLRIGRRHVR